MLPGFGDSRGNGSLSVLERYGCAIGDVERHLLRHDIQRTGRGCLLRMDGRGARQGGATDTRGQSAGCRDRKSTRLNSSHLVISYAVFCLKKKHEDLLT